MVDLLSSLFMSKKINGDRVNWGIIGVGDVCEVKSAPAMQKIKNSTIVAVMRRNAEKAADYASRHGIDKWYGNADQLITDPEINAIYVATPPSTHAEYVVAAAMSGKPVYVEKPMGINHAECVTMIDVCKQAGVPLYVAYYRRALPNFLKVKELIDDGKVGAVRAVNISLLKSVDNNISVKTEKNWRVNPSISGGGYFVDLASHQFDLLNYLFGRIVDVHGFSKNQAGLYPAEDIVTASFLFESGVLGVGKWCFTAAPCAEEEYITIIGSEGKLTFPCFGDAEVVLSRDGQHDEKFNFVYPQHIQQPLIETVVADLLGKGKCHSMGIDAEHANWVMDRILLED